MPRFSFPDVLREWIDPDVLGLTALPLPTHLDGGVVGCEVCGASCDGADSPIAAADRCELPDGIDLGPMRESQVAARYDTGRNEQTWLRPGSVAATFGTPAPILELDLDTLVAQLESSGPGPGSDAG